MTGTATQTSTYTAADVGKVLDCFAADFDMVAQATGLRTRENARATSEDVTRMAVHGYLKEVNVYLEDETGRIVRAAKYEVSTDAALWTAQRPGNNLWPRLPGGRLNVYVVWSDAWRRLSEARRQVFRETLKRPWGTWDLDTSFPTLTRRADRDYASNNYGMRKSVFQ
jgi:Bacterial HORMA domain family 1